MNLDLHPTCSTCRFLDTADKRCRRHCPQVTVIMIPQPPTLVSKGQPVIQPVAFADWPPIAEPDRQWCGDHEVQITSVRQ